MSCLWNCASLPASEWLPRQSTKHDRRGPVSPSVGLSDQNASEKLWVQCQPAGSSDLSRNPWGTPQACTPCGALQASPGRALTVAAPAFVVVVIAGCTSATTIRELWKNRIYDLWVLQGARHTQGCTAGFQVEKAWTWGAALLGPRVQAWSFTGSLSFGEFKT